MDGWLDGWMLLLPTDISSVDVSPLSVEDGLGEIEMVSEFTYLGSCLCDDGEVTNKVACGIARGSKAFGSLCEAIFMNRTFSVSTKRNVYKAVVLSILLYGAETWTIKTPDLCRLTTFHNRCVRSILGISSGKKELPPGICQRHSVCSGQFLT